MPFRMAVTMRVVQAQGYDEPRDAISHDWITWFNANGIEPILIPNGLSDVTRFVERNEMAALLMTNGEDVHPGVYGEDGEPGGYYSPIRDEAEMTLFGWALERGMPVLSVCRGFQLVNVLRGGRLVRDIPRDVPSAVEHVASTHKVRVVDEATRALACNDVSEVNSYHAQGVVSAGLGEGLLPLIEAEDGVIESFGMKNHDVLGIQWHPERPGPDTFCQQKLPLHFLMNGRWW
jgi:gamma-glutamyl-gamma-aminobutyrate hydrolase PuuD